MGMGMATDATDGRVDAGMRAQLARRSELLAAGRRHLGWKVGFGSPAAMRRLGTRAPLIGFMTDLSRLESGATCSLAGWTRAVLEPEIACYMGADLAAGADAARVRDAVAALGAAMEIADLDASVTDAESILATDIFHRHVVLGPPDASRAGGSVAGVTARVTRDGEEIAASDDPEALTGTLTDIIRSVAATLETQGMALRRGDVVIMGSLVPPIEVHAGERLRAQISPLGALEVRFA